MNVEKIYGKEFYGVYYHYKMEFSGVNLFVEKDDVKPSGFEFDEHFTIKLLPDFEGEKDVLCLEFTGTKEIAYETLYEPGLYYVNGNWVKSCDRETPEKFLKLCKLIC